MKKPFYTRRKFIKNTALASSLAFLPSGIMAKSFSPNDTLNLGLIGCKQRGQRVMKFFLKQPGVRCIAMCDVDQNVLETCAADITKITGKKPILYKDFRKLIENKDIDAVIIGTPDHWHCLPFVYACQEGKDVYVEKPLANTIEECNIMARATKRYNRIVQVGQQQRSGNHWMKAMEIMHSGKLGKIRKVNFWANFFYGAGPAPVPDQPVPAGVDYDMWLGPAPSRPFNANRFHGDWRMFWDYGGGLMTDWGVHLIDMGLWALKIDTFPKSISAMGGNFAQGEHACETADTHTTMYEFDDFHLLWQHNGGLQTGPYNRNYGVAFIGENGTIVANRANWVLYTEGKKDNKRMEEMEVHSADGMRNDDHVVDFIQAVKNRKNPVCDIETGRRAAIYTHLGNIAYRTGEKLFYDEKTNSFPNNPKANSYIKPQYREPWKLPKI